ncbi:MAG: hypothetical protein ACK51U_00385 [bacterium]|jgi:hypothetical protein
MQYIDVPAARHGQNTLSGWAGTFSVNQGDLFINLLGGSGGKEFYEGVILPNGDLKTNWQLTPSNPSYGPRRRYQLYFWFRPHRFWQR